MTELNESDRATKVLVVTPDVLGAKMAGPAIRAFEISRALARSVDVRLASTAGCTLESQGFPVEFADEDRLRELVDENDVLVFQGHTLSSYPWIIEHDIIVVADIYDPMHLEILEQGKDYDANERIERTLNTAEVLNTQIERADFMVCASEKQRDLWLGQLGALCRINPLTYDDDPSLRSLIDVAPFGIQENAPSRTGSAIKGVVPGISATDKVVLWGGGIYNWFDPLTLIRAIARLSTTHDDLRLFFLGAQHPNPNVPAMRMVTDARRLAEELGVLGSAVFFNDEWVQYDERANYLLDADLGVSTHFEHVETAFSFRTRILDYLWAGLPIVSTEGDTFAQLILEHDLGLVVQPEDADALASAIEIAVYAPSEVVRFRSNVAEFRKTMTWTQTLEPLIAFCEDPRHAADYRSSVVSPRENQRRHLRTRIEDLESSTIWRLTAPLRWMSKRIRSRPDRS